jgi:hypothetical protein
VQLEFKHWFAGDLYNSHKVGGHGSLFGNLEGNLQ